MGEDGNGQMGFQHSDKGEVNMPMSSVYGSGDWNPIVSMSQNGHFGASSMASHGEFNSSSSYSILLENHQGISATSHLDHYASDPNLAGTVPRIPIFGSGNFSEMVSSFGLQGVTHNSTAICPAKYTLNSTGAVEKASIGAEPAEKNCRISEEKAMGLSPNGKRKRELDQNASRSVQKDCSTETAEPKDHDDKKTKTEQNTAPSSSAKQTGKQTKDDAQDGEAQKANYIHVRARRGQATNSHSLAERVRREKISERMRLLQELVPGCNKITGKAVMLDEIINYVQSLQQQVEFLSMKLATVNPELNCDIDRILSKDILNSRSNAAHILGFNPGMSSTHNFTQGIHLGNLSPVPNTASQFHPIPQAIWDTDMQGLLHMGFDSSNPSLGNLEPNGSSKPEH